MEIYNKVNELAKKSTPKFTDTEKILLLSIIEDVKEIVESPKTDGPSVEKKKAIWELITEQYANSALNSGFSVRTEAQLKRCWTNLKYRCRRSDSVRKQHQLKTGGGPPIVIDDDEEDIHERVRSVVPTIDFTLKNQWDSTSEIERNMEDIQDTFKEEEIGNKADLDKYERENYSESSNENDHVPCYLAGDLSANAGLNEKVSKEVLLNKCLTINSTKSTITKISESDSSLNRHSSKSSTAGSSIQRKSMNVLQNILPKNDENRLNKCKDLTAEPSNKKRKYPTGLEIEQDLRIQKLEESTKQQSELHIEKLRIIRKECEYWDKMRAAAELEMQAMQAQLKYWTAKYTAIESDILDI